MSNASGARVLRARHRSELRRLLLGVLALIGAGSAGDARAGAPPLKPPITPPAAPAQPLRLSINGRDVTVHYSPDHDAAAVLAAVRAMGPSVVPQARPGVRGGMRARCRLEGDASDPVAARLELTCDQWRVTFVRLCPAGECRYAAIDRIYLREPPPRQR
jgi:hypothetical protein